MASSNRLFSSDSIPVPAVRAEALVKRYGERTVVDGVSLLVARGECFGLLGPNGAGKTTTLKMLLAQTPYTAGSIEVLGLPMPAAEREARARIGVVPQQDNLDPDFTVRENLITYARYFGLKPRDVRERIRSLLRFAALEARKDARISALSGGMQRRLTLARALVNDPELLVLDEPTTGLDPQARQHIWQRLRELLAEGRTLLLTTHYMEEAERLCDRIAIIDAGRIVATGSPRELIAKHIEPHVFELFDDGTTAAEVLAVLPDVRIETPGTTTLLYARDPAPVQEWIAATGIERYWYRPATLEDVFLRLTGRGLRDE
jgi:lipooligosaccharide transport system ATP-binding protein